MYIVSKNSLVLSIFVYSFTYASNIVWRKKRILYIKMCMIYKQCNYSILLLLYDFELENKTNLKLETNASSLLSYSSPDLGLSIVLISIEFFFLPSKALYRVLLALYISYENYYHIQTYIYIFFVLFLQNNWILYSPPCPS